MTDPFKILGISQNATDHEIKTAYHDMLSKYHKVSYVGNPLTVLAPRKIKKINEAYNQILKMRELYDGNHVTSNKSKKDISDINFDSIGKMISKDHLLDAQQLLDEVIENQRTAQWYFSSGMISYKYGWINEAYDHFKTANYMEPSNLEYQEQLTRLQGQMNGQVAYESYGNNINNPLVKKRCDIPCNMSKRETCKTCGACLYVFFDCCGGC
jgi:molecular chaperone DnaJ